MEFEINTGTTTAPELIEIKINEKEYWNESTENAVKRFLSLDFEHLTNSVAAYKKNKNIIDSGLEDGFLAEMHEKISYAITDEAEYEKEEIFKKQIANPLDKLVENIIYTYRLFSYDVDLKTLHNDCLNHVYLKFSNFDPSYNTKSYSYYGTIAKNYLQNRRKNLHDAKSVNLNYENHFDEIERKEFIGEDYNPEEDVSFDKFNFIYSKLKHEISKTNISANDKKVADAIMYLFENHKDFQPDDLKKQNIYNAIKEYTRLETREITHSLTRLRKLYKSKKEDFIKNKNQTDNFSKNKNKK